MDSRLYFMQLALLESEKAYPECLPNPPVGCILERNGKIVSKGYTHSPGHMHAEAHALKQVTGPLEDVTAYVTLEPCSFHGRTPSCALTLIERKIGRVIVSLIDPDPRNRGKGIQLLLEAGIAVETGVLQDEVAQFIGPFLNLSSNSSNQCSCC